MLPQGKIVAVAADDDIAFIESDAIGAGVAALGAEARLGDQLVAIGFPKRERREELDQFEALYEGRTQFLDASGRSGIEEKFKGGQVEPGFSGGPLLNMRTQRVMGVVVATRDKRSDLGGWAIETRVIQSHLENLSIDLPPPSAEWLSAGTAQIAQFSSQTDFGTTAVTPKQFQAPTLPRHYVKRTTELVKIIDLLTRDDSSGDGVLAITALHGLGGVGKTALATAVAHSHEIEERFTDGVLWVTLGQHPQILPLLNSWIQAVGERAAASWSIESANAFLRTTFHDKRFLLVVDDVWDHTDVEPFLVGGEKCRVLLTTRRAHIADLIGADTHELGSLTASEAYELLTKRRNSKLPILPSDHDERQTRELVEDVGFHPLAIELIGSLLARGYSLAEARRQLLVDDETDTSPTYQSQIRRRIDTCLSMSLGWLRQEDPQAWECFITLSVVADDQEISATIASHIWGLSFAEAESILIGLADDSLLKRDGSLYSIHDLMHEAARKLLVTPRPAGLGLSMTEGHRKIISNYRASTEGQLTQVQNDGYIYSRLVWHLTAAGLDDDVRDLLTSENERGENAWFAKRAAVGEIGGYVEDVRLALKQARLRRPERISEQLLWALCITSINSSTANLTPRMLVALVEYGFWGAARGYQWTTEVCDAVSRPRFLIALARGVNLSLVRHSSDERIRELAVRHARELLVAQGPSQANFNIMGELVGLLDREEQSLVISEVLENWCTDARSSKDFVRRLPAKARYPAFELLYKQLGTISDHLQKLDILSASVAVVPVTERDAHIKLFLESLDAYFDSKKTMSTERRLPSSAKSWWTKDGRDDSRDDKPKLALPAAIDPDRDEKDLDRDENLADAGEDPQRELEHFVHQILEYVPESLDERFRFTLNRFPRAAQRRRLDKRINEVKERRISSPFANFANPSTELRKFLLQGLRGLMEWYEEEISEYFDNVRDSPEDKFDYVIEMINHEDAGISKNKTRNIERFWFYLFSLLKGTTAERQVEVARRFCERNPSAVGPRTLLCKAEENQEIHIEKIIAELANIDNRLELEAAVTACVSAGIEQLAGKALGTYLHVGDIDERASAVFALMPYVPRVQLAASIAELKDENIFGPQIAGLTSILADLVTALQAGALSEVIEAASRQYSEWWVVEALTLTIRRLETESELQAVVASSRRLRNGDLRARIIGRTARRMADLGLMHAAIAAAESIELEQARWDELAELSVRIASSGNASSAIGAASKIRRVDDQSRAFAHIALEIGALGRMSEARELAHRYIVVSSWKSWVMTYVHGPELSTGEQPASAKISDRMTFRRQSDGVIDEFTMVKNAAAQIRDVAGMLPPLSDIQAGADAQDPASMLKAVERLWAWEDTIGRGLIHQLSLNVRPKLLAAVASMAPLIGVGDCGAEASNTVQAIKDVGRWWP
jgi:hypothetical protein